ncbi:uncharacterized protein VTP21DRAFT_11153 [Calcarisporiella thermophila]|uniref:uncharacterized protein n=1 Tax=Calcarisporiella thermophila TaxID=911321 RepID=UPI0037426C41
MPLVIDDKSQFSQDLEDPPSSSSSSSPSSSTPSILMPRTLIGADHLRMVSRLRERRDHRHHILHQTRRSSSHHFQTSSSILATPRVMNQRSSFYSELAPIEMRRAEQIEYAVDSLSSSPPSPPRSLSPRERGTVEREEDEEEKIDEEDTSVAMEGIEIESSRDNSNGWTRRRGSRYWEQLPDVPIDPQQLREEIEWAENDDRLSNEGEEFSNLHLSENTRRRLQMAYNLDKMNPEIPEEATGADVSYMSKSTFLQPGQVIFVGYQHMNQFRHGAECEDWETRVMVTAADYTKGSMEGIMEALNVPAISGAVVTFWEGEIIDFVHNTFWTRKWHATLDIDERHWSKFEPFRGLSASELRRCLSTVEGFHRVSRGYIFMRWKERVFVSNTASSSLTIAGFYYICMNRSNGNIEGYYYDPNSKPYQRLTLEPQHNGQGISFPMFSFA